MFFCESFSQTKYLHLIYSILILTKKDNLKRYFANELLIMDFLKKDFIFQDVNKLEGVGLKLTKYLKKKKNL